MFGTAEVLQFLVCGRRATAPPGTICNPVTRLALWKVGAAVVERRCLVSACADCAPQYFDKLSPINTYLWLVLPLQEPSFSPFSRSNPEFPDSHPGETPGINGNTPLPALRTHFRPHCSGKHSVLWSVLSQLALTLYFTALCAH